MTRKQAIKKLAATQSLTTDLLKPLGIPFDAFLQLAQRSDADAIEKKLIERICGVQS